MSHTWFGHYPENVPHNIDSSPYNSIVDVFNEAVRKFGPRSSFENMGAKISYDELDELSSQMASFYQNELKLEKGDKIALQMPNIIQYPICLFAAFKAGLIVVNTNPLYTEREMEHQFKDSEAKAIVILANFADKLEKILNKTNIQHVVVTELGDSLPFPKRLLVNAVVKHVKKMVPSFNLPNSYSFHKALKLGTSNTYMQPPLARDDIAFLQYTGGTTGVAKGAMLTHENIISNMLQIGEWMKPLFKEGKEAIMTPLPLYHIFSLTVNCLAFMWFGASNILITNPRDIPGFIKELKSNKFSALSGLNTLFNALLNHPDFESVDFSNVKLTVAGGMALQKEVSRKWVESTQSQIIEGYGLTESSPVASANPVIGKNEVGTIGIPLPSTEMAIFSEEGKRLPVGEEGEIFIKGPQVMKGYWKRPDETDKVLTSDGWLKTGDIGMQRDDGYFKITDRKKDMILVSGFNVYPNEIEEVYVKHPKVLEVAAVGKQDDHSGEVVQIFVVATDSSVTKDDLIAHGKEHLTGYKRPKIIEFREELPKSNVGKILRRPLREEANGRAQA